MTESEKRELKQRLVQFDLMLRGFVSESQEIGMTAAEGRAIVDAYFDLQEEIEKYLDFLTETEK